jgi:aerobic carbon-monoxide dehydrogenase medium subunit
MKAARFAYHRPDSLDEALALRAEHADDCAVLAGGQSLVPLLNLRLALPSAVIDLGGVPELSGIRVDRPGVTAGSMTRQRHLELSPVVAERFPLVRQALAYVGHPAIRNRGTVGGSLAHADPAAELPAVALALDAQLVAQSTRGRRTIPAEEFFRGYLSTAIEPDELLVEISLPPVSEGAGCGFAETARRHGDFALAGAAALIQLDDGGAIADVRIAFFGAHAKPVRARAVEGGLIGGRPDEATFREAAEAAASELEPTSDGHASAAYRRRVAAVMARRALVEAGARA